MVEIQQGMLKMVEGTIVNVPDKNSAGKTGGDKVQVDTTNILFVCAGAFNGLDKIVSHRKNENRLGFDMKANSSQDCKTDTNEAQNERDHYLSEVETYDLIRFGMIPEFVGRFPALVPFHSLDSNMLIRILTEPKNALIPQYQMLFDMDKVKLTFSNEALKTISTNAMKKKTGARGLRGILEKLLLESMYEIPASDITSIEITEDTVLGKCPPTYYTTV